MKPAMINGGQQSGMSVGAPIQPLQMNPARFANNHIPIGAPVAASTIDLTGDSDGEEVSLGLRLGAEVYFPRCCSDFHLLSTAAPA